jgi:hypothetical protein
MKSRAHFRLIIVGITALLMATSVAHAVDYRLECFSGPFERDRIILRIKPNEMVVLLTDDNGNTFKLPFTKTKVSIFKFKGVNWKCHA